MELGLKLNLLLAWAWILGGFLSGMLLGLKFHQENWLGGYSSHKRRLYRLGHISFFGLGLLNFVFYLTASQLGGSASFWYPASIAFALGALTMPVCCILMAHNARLHMIFSIPVVSLITGALFTLWNLIKL